MTAAGLIALIAGAPAAVGIPAPAAARRARSDAPTPGRRLHRALLALGRRVGTPAAPRDLQARLGAAGVALTVADAMSVKAGAAAAGALTGLVLVAGAPGRLG